MSLSAADRAVIERWAGRVRTAADEDACTERIDRLGNAHMAALEMLMVIRADMVVSATKVRSGDDAVDHTANLRRIDAQIAQLVALIMELDLSTDDDMLSEALGAPLAVTRSFDTVARNTRRG